VITEDNRLTLSASVSRRVTAVDLVRETLRSAILRGDLPGGSRLVQTEIASQLDVSTTPVREAMRDLASQGLISLDSHRIGTVRKPDWDEMTEIVVVRRALERPAIERWMKNLTAEDVETARRLADELAEIEDTGTWVQKNNEFHSVFHRATSTKRLGGILVDLESAGNVFVAQAQRLAPEMRKRAIADHYALLDAYEVRDVDRAYEIQYDHVNLPLEALTAQE
jgi:DNA-binding GntR family transcriptional regulator